MPERPLEVPNFEKKLHVVLFCAYPMGRPGGVQERVRNMAKKYMEEYGYEVTIVNPYSRTHPQENGTLQLGVSRTYKIKGTSVEAALFPDANVFARLEDIHADIYEHHEPELYGVSMVAHWINGPYNFDVFHASLPKDASWKYMTWRPISALFASRITGRSLVSSANLAAAQKIFPGEYEIIPNGVDTNRFNPRVEPIEKFMDGKQNILFVGRLEDRKGLTFLMDAYAFLLADLPNTRLIVVGNGPNRRAYKYYADEIMKSTCGEICFEDEVSPELLPRYYRRADVFSSSAFRDESQGIVNLEAMASGVPCVSGDNPGYRTAIKSGYDGVLVDVKDPEAYAHALNLVLSDESYRNNLIKHGLITARSNDWSQVAKKNLDFQKRQIEERIGRQKAR